MKRKPHTVRRRTRVREMLNRLETDANRCKIRELNEAKAALKVASSNRPMVAKPGGGKMPLDTPEYGAAVRRYETAKAVIAKTARTTNAVDN